MAGMRVVRRAAVYQFVNLDGNEKGRFADGQPAGPAYPKDQANCFDKRKEAVNQCAGGSPQDFHFGELADLFGELSPKLSLRVEPKMVQQTLVFLRQVVVRQGPKGNGQADKERPFE